MSVFVTFKQYESALKRIERANLKTHGRSLTFVSMSNHAGDLTIEVQSDRKGTLMVDNWRQELKQRFLKTSKPMTAAEVAAAAEQDPVWFALHKVSTSMNYHVLGFSHKHDADGYYYFQLKEFSDLVGIPGQDVFTVID